MEIGDNVEDIGNLRQGDVISLSWIPTMVDGQPSALDTPQGVALLSQTCDVVQSSASKSHVIVAPIAVDPSPSMLSIARSGQSPQSVYLPQCGDSTARIADLQRAASVPKDALRGQTLLARHTGHESDSGARRLAELIGRSFSRFAFPDPVVAALDKMKKKARKAASRSGDFGRVLDRLDFRVSADQWDQPGRHLKIYVMVSSRLLISVEDADPAWSWETAGIKGLKPQESVARADLTRLSTLLADTCDEYLNSPLNTDGTTVLRLWEAWCERLQHELLAPQTNEEVVDVQVDLMNDEEFTVARWKRTVTLDLEDLSEAPMGVEHER